MVVKKVEQKKVNSTVAERRQFKNPTNIRLLIGLHQTDLRFRRAIPIDNKEIQKEK